MSRSEPDLDQCPLRAVLVCRVKKGVRPSDVRRVLPGDRAGENGSLRQKTVGEGRQNDSRAVCSREPWLPRVGADREIDLRGTALAVGIGGENEQDEESKLEERCDASQIWVSHGWGRMA